MFSFNHQGLRCMSLFWGVVVAPSRFVGFKGSNWLFCIHLMNLAKQISEGKLDLPLQWSFGTPCLFVVHPGEYHPDIYIYRYTVFISSHYTKEDPNKKENNHQDFHGRSQQKRKKTIIRISKVHILINYGVLQMLSLTLLGKDLGLFQGAWCLPHHH